MPTVNERRFASTEMEFRASPKPGTLGVLSAYAAVFRRFSQDLGGFVEQVEPGSFKKTLQEADIRALFNHDPNRLLGRNRAGTLRLAEDSTGLHYEVDIPDTSEGRDLATLVDRGDLTGSSFGFRVIEDDWGLTEQEYPLRSLRQVHLYDVGPVVYPAYLATEEADTKAAVRSLAAHLNVEPQVIESALEARNLRDLIDPPADDEPAVDETSESGEARQEPGDPTPDDADALRRMRLQLEAIKHGTA